MQKVWQVSLSSLASGQLCCRDILRHTCPWPFGLAFAVMQVTAGWQTTNMIQLFSSSTGVPMIPVSWQEMQCPQTKAVEKRKVAKA